YTVTEDRFYDNRILVTKLFHIQQMRIMITGSDNERDVSEVNAFYTDFFHKIRVYAGILQPPVFSLIFP
ncbi:unnamed protein product, partial [Candidula unifasciata]